MMTKSITPSISKAIWGSVIGRARSLGHGLGMRCLVLVDMQDRGLDLLDVGQPPAANARRAGT